MASMQAQAVAPSDQQEVSNQQVQNDMFGTIDNRSWANMQLIKYHSWSGNFTVLPTTLTTHTSVRIEHVRGHEQRSQAAVMYSMTSATGAPYAVVVAWDAPANFNPTSSPNRVWATVGPRPNMELMTWDAIRTQLVKSGPSEILTYPTPSLIAQSTIIRSPSHNMANLVTYFFRMDADSAEAGTVAVP